MQPGPIRGGVIVADDSMAIRDNVRVALGDAWHIFLAADGVEAVDYAHDVIADLVLLDFRMPRLDGILACQTMRRLPGYPAVPIVLLTAHDSADLRQRALRAGATAVFPKPFSASVLREAALPLIALGRDAARSGAPGPAAMSPGLTSAGGNDLAAGRDVLAVHRKVDAAAQRRTYRTFAEIMAAQRALSRS